MRTSGLIILRRDGFVLGLLPDTGGSVAFFQHEGTDLMRASKGCLPKDMAAFPLFPFSGRIGLGRFLWKGRVVQLEMNSPPEPHAIHGQSWQKKWDIVTSTTDSAILQYAHAGDDWPWAYRAEQHFRLDRNGLTLELVLTNLSDESMPAGIGWHPFFPSAGAEIQADTNLVWEIGPDMLPLAPRLPSASEQLCGGSPVSRLVLDTPFATGSRPITIRWPVYRRILRVLPDDTLRFLIVYTPLGEDYFCAEPVSHVPNMVNQDASAEEVGLVDLAPGNSLKGTVSLELTLQAGGQDLGDHHRPTS